MQLRVEDFCRFQHHHERDFELLNFVLSADMLFKQWLDHKENSDFKALFDSRPIAEQQKLMDHMYSPFVLMNDISKKTHPGQEWDFKSTNNSVYMYPSILGQGWTSSISVLAIQLVIPGALLYGALVISPRFGNGTLLSFNTSPEQFCMQTGNVGSLIVNFCVIVFYAIRQLPLILYTFFETAGEADTPRSRLTSLRTYVWELGRDTLEMQIGYKVDKYMNSVYIALCNSLMLFVTFLSDNPIDIILNAIAMEFVVYFGQEVARSVWLDPTTRYIRAGGVELVMRTVLDIRALKNVDTFARKFDIPKDLLMDTLSADDYSPRDCLCNARLSGKDDQNPLFFDPKNQVWKLAEIYAVKSRNKQATWLFREKLSHFDVIARWLSLFNLDSHAILRRFEDYHCWSRWEKVLFLSPCSTVTRTSDTTYIVESIYRPPQLASTKIEDGEIFKTHAFSLTSPYLNDTYESDRNVYERFMYDILRTLTFSAYFSSVRNAIKQRSVLGLLFRIVDGFVEWFSYAYLCLFPFTLIGAAVLLFTCY
jgi:hypothetical protein